MDELLAAMYKVSVQLVPILGVAVLCFLIYLFTAPPGLPCCPGFSLVAESGGYSSLQRSGFALQRPLLLRSSGSRARRLQ